VTALFVQCSGFNVLFSQPFGIGLTLICMEQEGEPVEFTASVDHRGRNQASRVTGPMGAFVQGAARRQTMDFDYGGAFGGRGRGGAPFRDRNAGGFGGERGGGRRDRFEDEFDQDFSLGGFGDHDSTKQSPTDSSNTK
jgi:hypothetical protein